MMIYIIGTEAIRLNRGGVVSHLARTFQPLINIYSQGGGKENDPTYRCSLTFQFMCRHFLNFSVLFLLTYQNVCYNYHVLIRATHHVFTRCCHPATMQLGPCTSYIKVHDRMMIYIIQMRGCCCSYRKILRYISSTQRWGKQNLLHQACKD